MTDTEAEFRKKDREYFDLIGRNVICRNQVLPIIAFQWLRFGAGHLFTLQLPDGREMGAQRDEFFVPPTREQISEALLAAWIVQTELKVEATPVEHCRALADAVLPLLIPKGEDR